ncbi:MAG TPA: prepilin-type N-terminal cleavage/methylation domain-containing protein [Myxococcaceae bacterium]|nr:prepilin-type N-terminal cleavage/methylation domain-containing protein [Myxococcaceae bacterium]
MRPKSRGMTLLELMTAVAIVSISVGLSVAGYQTANRKQRGANAAREMLAEIAKARKLAVTTAQPVRFVVRNVTEGGRQVRRGRWEQLRRDTGWERSAMPMAACQSRLCGVGGCLCDATGREVDVPAEVTVNWNNDVATSGVCFLPGTGEARRGWRCLDTDPALATGSLSLTFAHDVPRHIMVDGTTGQVRLFDCGSANKAGAPTTGCP